MCSGEYISAALSWQRPSKKKTPSWQAGRLAIRSMKTLDSLRTDYRIPAAYMQIVGKACRHDAEYFEEHPGIDRYIRVYCPGEFWPLRLPQGSMVEVVELRRGVRARRAYLPATGGEERAA
jgi:hypothetical protein